MTQGEVGADDLDAVLCIIDGIHIEISDDILCYMRLAVDDAYHLFVGSCCCIWLEILYQIILLLVSPELSAVHILSAHLIPHFEEYLLQGIHLTAVDSAVHIVPFAYHLCTFYIIVGYVHTARIGYLSVDDNDFAVITVENRMYPWELKGLIFINLYAVGTDFLEMSLSQRLVVGRISETVIQGSHLHTLLYLLCKNIKEKGGDAVVAKVEVFQVYTMFSLSDCLEHIIKLFLTVHQ